MASIGQIIREYREKHGLSLREFAQKAGLSHAYIDKLENGFDPVTKKPVTPTLRTIELLAQAMEMTPEEIMSAAGYISNSSKKEKQHDEATRLFARLSGLTPEGREKVLRELEWIEELERKRFLERKKKQNQEKN
ncbi:HTH-type transcriptional repressor RghR [Moorella thermoacetica]|uniref:HTH-type transcriptional repressor RghR n=1 Tax=Neomoorella thermoacetica TaxID=1525 RepID=A0A1J5JPV7_NEOTH|nr:helix-turn-helix transcriptional regulator [Moorella thermoacetica]OIQ08755.1 HTH-type transcriptional repressor RghR [Moorella thermoacetica]